MGEETHEFQAEVSRLLDIVAHSLYSNKEIFLRELISNASDACDRLRYAALTQPELLSDGDALGIEVSVDPKTRMLSVTDNGIGMNREDLVSNLGTIARSGTAAFVDNLSGDDKNDLSLIGQFGVGFYSAFMVAESVEVVSRKAGEDKAWRWTSDGTGKYTIDEAPSETERGTSVRVRLAKAQKEFLEPARLRHIVATYSDHVALPITLKGAAGDGSAADQLNAGSALWARSKSDISADQYKEFYHHVAHAFDEPWLTLHNKVEGVIEYTNLLFIPSVRPFDLFQPERKHSVKLYVRRVFITDKCEDLLPGWLRFVRGIVDSEDLPLNISREMLQHNPVLTKIRTGLVKRIIAALKTKAKKAPDDYATFWKSFGAVLKEGLYEDDSHRDSLLGLARFQSTHQRVADDAWISLADYVERMKDGQEDIYYLAGDDAAALEQSPQLEGFRAKGIEVLLLADPVDSFWMPSVGEYEGKKFRSVTRADVELDAIKTGEEPETPPAADANLSSLTALLKLTLQDEVKDVRESHRLTDSAVCLVADDQDVDMHMERMLRQHRRLDVGAKRVLEINPKHALIQGLARQVTRKGSSDDLADFAYLLLDQARIVEGETVADPAAFAQRLSAVMARGLGE